MLIEDTHAAYLGESTKDDVYRTVSGSPSGPGPGAQLLIKEYNEGAHECVATPGSLCAEVRYERASRTASATAVQWELARGTNTQLCCLNMGTVSIIVDTPYDATPNDGRPPVPRYSIGTNSILLPPNGSGNEWSLSSDVIAHELAHAYTKAYNGILTYATEDFAAVLREGLADAMTGAAAQKLGNGPAPHHNWGSPWVIGDAHPPISSPRNMTTNRSFSFTVPNGSNDFHTRSMAISNFFYRLSLQTAAITNTRLIELLLQVADTVYDQDGDGFDLEDLRRAIAQSVKPGETALLQKINEIWAAMDDTVVVIGGPPKAPWTVDGHVSNSCSNGRTWYAVYWSPSQGATYYEGWVRFSNGQYYYSYSYPAGTTTGSASTPYNSDAKMRACNQYGCSGLSADSLPLTYLCQ